jgi:hypothetical protein
MISKNYLTRSVVLIVFSFLIYSVRGHAQTSITSNLPIIVINTNGGVIQNNDKIPASFKIVAPGPGGNYSFDMNSPTNTFQFDGPIGIEIRGNTSTYWDKKSYSVETRDAPDGDNVDVSLLGMPAESDWVLNACYGDKSFIRDVFAHEMFTRTGRYSPKTKYVEVYLQEIGGMAYHGVYILMEKVKRSSNRINIKKLSETDIDPVKISGGYLLQVGEDEDLKWVSGIEPNNAPLQPKPIFHVEYPKLHNYTNIPNRTLQFNYIKSHIDNFEQKLNGPNYKDATNGYRPLLDVDAMVDYLLLQELTKNSDNWRASTFLYKKRDDEGGQIVMGAPWDFDKSMGNQQWCYELSVLPTGSWAWQFNVFCQDRPPMTVFWPARLLTDCYFKNKVVARYKQLRLTQWSNQNITAFVDTKQAELTAQGAMQRNFSKWNILEVGVMFNEHYTLPGNTYAKEVQYLKTWLLNHLAWMDTNIESISSETCSVLPVTFSSFELQKMENAVIVRWATAEERKNDHFEIEKSKDGRHFEKAGVVTGKGDSNENIDYEFLDQNPFAGTSYYRIRQVDTDGSYEFTSVKAIKLGDEKSPTILFPNPAQDAVKLDHLQPGSLITISDQKGKKVIEWPSLGKAATIPVDKLMPGVYVLSIRDNDGVPAESHTFIIQK